MSDKITIQFKGSDDKFDIRLQPQEPLKIFETTPIGNTADYNRLMNLPTINGVTVIGNLTSEDLHLSGICKYDTRAGWEANSTYVPERGEIILYQDKDTINGVVYAGIKIGDGNAYVVDLPFIGDEISIRLMSTIEDHIRDTTMHTTAQEKAFWNNKLNYEISGEELVFNRL